MTMKRGWTGLAVLALTAGAIATHSFSAGAGKLKVATPGMILDLDVRGRNVSVPPMREVPMAAGTYTVKGIKIHAQEVDARRRVTLWRCDGQAPFGKLAAIQIAEGQTTSVEGGEPLVVKTPLSVTQKSGATTVYVGLGFYGKSGERYRTVVYKGRSRVPNPKIMFLDESGKPLHTGAYEYG